MNDNFFVFTNNKLKKIIEQILNTNKNIDNVDKDIQTVQTDIVNLDTRIDELQNNIQTLEMNSLANSLQVIKNSLLHPATLQLDSVDNVQIGDPVDMLIGVPNKNILIDEGDSKSPNTNYSLEPSNFFKIDNNDDGKYEVYFLQPTTRNASKTSTYVQKYVLTSNMTPIEYSYQGLSEYLSTNTGLSLFDSYYDENTGIEYFICGTGTSSNTESYIVKKKNTEITFFSFERDLYSDMGVIDINAISLHSVGCNKGHIRVISENLLVVSVGVYIYLIQLSDNMATIKTTYDISVESGDYFKTGYLWESNCTSCMYINTSNQHIYHICRRYYRTSSSTVTYYYRFEVRVILYDESNNTLSLVRTEVIYHATGNTDNRMVNSGTVLFTPSQSVVKPKIDSDDWVLPVVLYTSKDNIYAYFITITNSSEISYEYFNLPNISSYYWLCPSFINATKILYPYYDGETKMAIINKKKGITEKVIIGTIDNPKDYSFATIYPFPIKDTLMYFHAKPNQSGSSDDYFGCPSIFNLYKAPAYQLGLVTDIDKENNLIEVAQAGACYTSIPNTKGSLVKSNHMFELGRYQASNIIELYNYDADGNKIV